MVGAWGSPPAGSVRAPPTQPPGFLASHLCLPPSDVHSVPRIEEVSSQTPPPLGSQAAKVWSMLNRNRKLAQVVWVQFLYFSYSDFPHSDPAPSTEDSPPGLDLQFEVPSPWKGLKPRRSTHQLATKASDHLIRDGVGTWESPLKKFLGGNSIPAAGSEAQPKAQLHGPEHHPGPGSTPAPC